MKVLHILRQLNPGGIECWLERLIQAWPLDRRPELHIALEESNFGVMAPAFRSQGVYLHHVPAPRTGKRALDALTVVLKSAGPFEAIHCHNHHASAFPLAIARAHGVPVRIAHSHADFRLRSRPWLRRGYEGTARHFLNRFANSKLAVSSGAALDLFGTADSPIRFLPCGTDLSGFLQAPREPDPARFTLVHVGRLVPEKNHRFLLQVFNVLVQQCAGARLWLVGDGPLCSALQSEISQLGLSAHVEFLGNRSDIASLFAQSDLFLFPSLSEGLGLAAIEAQAAGLPVLLADHLPAELDIVSGLHRRLALHLPIDKWADTALKLRSAVPVSDSIRRQAFSDSPFCLASNIKALEEIYAGN